MNLPFGMASSANNPKPDVPFLTLRLNCGGRGQEYFILFFGCNDSTILLNENEPMMWTVYLLRCSDQTLYTGITNNLEQRVKAHNEGKGAKYTRGRGPVEVVWSQTGFSKSEALKIELRIKNFSRKEKEALIASNRLFMNKNKIELGRIDEYKEFLPLDKLYKQFLSIAGKEFVSEIGRSKNKGPILCGTFGTGKKSILLFGYPHPNEPVGSLTCLSWVKILKKNPELLKEYTWYIVPCADPDGARLNEGWFAGPFSIKKYVQGFYRQTNNQTEWSFPVTYKDYSFQTPTPQTKVLMKLIDRVKPSIIYSLHNSGFSGAYFLLSRDLGPAFMRKVELSAKRLGIPLHKGAPEVPFAKLFKPGFIKLFGIKEEYDFIKKMQGDPLKQLVGGTSSAEYAKTLRKNAFSLVCEIPYVFDPVMSDARKSKRKKKDAIDSMLQDFSLVRSIVWDQLKMKELNLKSVFYAITKENLALLDSQIKTFQTIQTTVPDVYLTNAEVFSAEVVSVFYKTLILGELRRLLLDSPKNIQRKKNLKQIDELIDKRVQWIEDQSNVTITSISSLVELQLTYLMEVLHAL